MALDSVADETPGQAATRSDPISGSGVLEDARSLWHELTELIHARFQLAALETQRAGKSLVTMIVAGVMVAVLLSGAWLGLMAAAVLALIENGLAPSRALLLAVGFNVLFALILWGVIRRTSRHLQFPATLRSLQPLPPASRDMEEA